MCQSSLSSVGESTEKHETCDDQQYIIHNILIKAAKNEFHGMAHEMVRNAAVMGCRNRMNSHFSTNIAGCTYALFKAPIDYVTYIQKAKRYTMLIHVEICHFPFK